MMVGQSRVRTPGPGTWNDRAGEESWLRRLVPRIARGGDSRIHGRIVDAPAGQGSSPTSAAVPRRLMRSQFAA